MYFNNHCRICPEDVHCCIFRNDSGFSFVGLKDAENIRKKTGKEYKEFLDYSSLPPKIVPALKNDDPALEGALRYLLLNKNRILRLKSKDDGRCIFLNGKGKCDIYEFRPNICRIYPFWAIRLEGGDLKIIEHDPDPRCSIVHNNEPDRILSEKQAREIKKIFRAIEKEALEYEKGIESFVNNI